MKKFLCSIFVFIMIFALVGCNNTGEAKLARRLSVNTNNLLQAINNLESVTNEDVAISDFLNENNSINNISYEVNYNQPIKKVSKFKQIFSGGFIDGIKNVNTYNEKRIMPLNSDFSPRKSANDNTNYKAKYTTSNENDDNLNNTFIELYKNRMESLYNACGDCLYVNTQCNNCQSELKTGIEECKTLCEKLNNGEIVLNESQLKECNSYCDEINNLCTKIKGCKGNCNSYLNTLKSLKSYFGSNTENLTTNYLNLLDCLECRLGYYNQALNCVNKCNSLLKSCYTPKLEENDSNLDNYNINNTNKTQNTQINRPVTQPIINGNRPVNNFNGYNSNNGIYNNGFGYGYGYNGYGINPYNQTPNNVNTYGPINRNVDTYNNVVRNTDTFNLNEQTTENNNTNQDTNENKEEKDYFQTRKIIKRPKYIKERDTQSLNTKNFETNKNQENEKINNTLNDLNTIKEPRKVEFNNKKIEEENSNKVKEKDNNEEINLLNEKQNNLVVETEPYVEHSTNTNPFTKDIKTDENLKHKNKVETTENSLNLLTEPKTENLEQEKELQENEKLEQKEKINDEEKVLNIVDKKEDGEKVGTMQETKPTFLSSNA